MGREITYTAKDYSTTKKDAPFRDHIEMFTILSLLGDPKGKRILDAGCGDGIYSRYLIDRGAAYVIGVDGSADFVELARRKNKGYEAKIEYHHSFIQDFPGNGEMDAVVGSFILSYPKTLEEAVSFCRSIATHLKDKGRFIGFNNNPFEVFNGSGNYSKYGFEKEMGGDVEGGEVVYRIPGMEDPIINYYLRPETYEQAFREAGFSEFEWKRVLLNPSERGNTYWEEFFRGQPPFIAMLARK